MSQIALPFDWPTPEGADAFIVTEANRRAVDGIDRSGSWPVRSALLTGPRKSGRSLLARIFAARTGGTIIDDAEHRRESEIFHRWNLAQEERVPLLIVAQSPPPLWKVGLADLASRLAATPIFSIGEPDDRLIVGLLEKLLLNRGLQPDAATLAYVSERIERSYIMVMRVVDALDSAALSRRRGLSISLARSALKDLHQIADEDELG